jgi:hypothetical protein
MGKRILAIVLVGSGLVLAVATGTLVNRLTDQMVWVCTGGGMVLAVVLAVGALLMGQNALNAYANHRQMAQDGMNDLKQMALVMRLTGNLRTPNVNVRLPQGQNQAWPYPWVIPQQQQLPPPVGHYQDTVTGETIELE